LEDQHSQRLDLVLRQMAMENPNAEVFQRIEDTLKSGHKVWWVGNVTFPRPGDQLTPLGPAPDPKTGWSAIPYVFFWTRQLGAFIQSHKVQSEPITFPEPVCMLEYEQLLLVEGWR
jgi:hypothetical protein